MSMQIEWIGLAEASVEDGRGVAALIGVQQNVVAAPSLPISGVKRVVPVFISDNDASSPVLVEGERVTVRMTVESPTGDVLLFARQTHTIGPPKWRGIPISVHIFAEMQFEITEYGTHTIRVEADRPLLTFARSHADSHRFKVVRSLHLSAPSACRSEGDLTVFLSPSPLSS